MLLIDAKMPKNCAECPCLKLGEYGAFEKSSCGIKNGMIISQKRRAKGCPLKEKPTGKWEHISYYSGGYGINETCSNCGHTIHGQIFDLVDKYCPNCGAQMKQQGEQ